MSLFIGFLTFVLIVISMVLILLILIQLPKKEAGMGVAFGGGATDALFGAGSGNVLTKVTKYCAGGFLALSLILSILNGHMMKSTTTRVKKVLEQKAAAAATPSAAPAPASKPATNLLLTTTNIAIPAAPAKPSTAPAPTPAPAPAPGK